MVLDPDLGPYCLQYDQATKVHEQMREQTITVVNG